MADLCYGCMKDAKGEQICPHCGFSKDTVQNSPFLPLGTKLDKDRYTVGRVLDNRSDSARYIAFDNTENKTVLIREFLPKDLFTRSEDSVVVTVSKNINKKFIALKQQFIQLGNELAMIKNKENLVAVLGVFQDNNTAYMVEEYEDVISFGEYIQRSGGRLEWEIARPLIKPLLDTLADLSDISLNHYAICPANLVVTADGKVKLGGFAIRDVRQVGHELPPQLFSGCSALEQYEEQGVLDIKTDIYGFCATLFFTLTGKLPADAVKRKEDGRLLMSKEIVKKLPPYVISTLAKGLMVDKNERISSFNQLQNQLSASQAVEAIQSEISKTLEVSLPEQEKKGGLSNFQLGTISMIVSLVIFGIIGFMWYSTNPLDGLFDVNNTATENPSGATEIMPDDFTYAPDSEYFRVPDFTGKTFEEAEAIASENTEYFIFKAIDEEFSDTVTQGKICRQTPEAKKTVSRGHDGVTITCYISKGAQYRALPKVEKVNKDKAVENLVKEGFVVNSTLTYSDTVEAGCVVDYAGNVKAGDKMEYGSAITLNISLGKKPEEATDAQFVYADPTNPVATPTT